MGARTPGALTVGAMSPVPSTAELLDTVLDTVDVDVAGQGRDLVDGGAVHQLLIDEAETTATVVAGGGGLWTVVLRRGTAGLEPWCSCAAEGPWCAHAVAVAEAWADGAGDDVSMSAVTDGDADDAVVADAHAAAWADGAGDSADNDAWDDWLWHDAPAEPVARPRGARKRRSSRTRRVRSDTRPGTGSGPPHGEPAAGPLGEPQPDPDPQPEPGDGQRREPAGSAEVPPEAAGEDSGPFGAPPPRTGGWWDEPVVVGERRGIIPPRDWTWIRHAFLAVSNDDWPRLYKTLAFCLHPDRRDGDGEGMQALAKVWQQLRG